MRKKKNYAPARSDGLYAYIVGFGMDMRIEWHPNLDAARVGIYASRATTGEMARFRDTGVVGRTL